MERFDVILKDGTKYSFDYNAFSWTFDSELLRVWSCKDIRNKLVVNLSEFSRLFVYDWEYFCPILHKAEGDCEPYGGGSDE